MGPGERMCTWAQLAPFSAYDVPPDGEPGRPAVATTAVHVNSSTCCRILDRRPAWRVVVTLGKPKTRAPLSTSIRKSVHDALEQQLFSHPREYRENDEHPQPQEEKPSGHFRGTVSHTAPSKGACTADRRKKSIPLLTSPARTVRGSDHCLNAMLSRPFHERNSAQGRNDC